MTRRHLLPAILGLVLLGAAAPAAAQEKEEGYQPLFNGKDLSDFELVGAPASTWSVKDGVISATGKPNGYIATKKSYGNYSLKFDIRYPEKPGNSGFLIHIEPPHKVWPKCVEVQGQYNNLCMIFAIQGAKGPRTTLPENHAEVRKPHNEWNSVEIISQDGRLTSKLNGAEIGSGQYSLKQGPIGFQSEGAPVEFRNLRIKEVK